MEKASYRIIKEDGIVCPVYWVQKREADWLYSTDWHNIGNGRNIDDAKKYIEKYKNRHKPNVVHEDYKKNNKEKKVGNMIWNIIEYLEAHTPRRFRGWVIPFLVLSALVAVNFIEATFLWEA